MLSKHANKIWFFAVNVLILAIGVLLIRNYEQNKSKNTTNAIPVEPPISEIQNNDLELSDQEAADSSSLTNQNASVSIPSATNSSAAKSNANKTSNPKPSTKTKTS
jgi:hypothetical protein